jgi:DNA-binding IclR family transcriptional regulator
MTSEKPLRTRYNPLVPAVEQASRLLVFLGKHPKFKLSLTEICNEIGIHKSRGYSLLHTLIQYGFVEREPQTKTYSLGPGLLPLARKVLDHLDLREIAGPFLAELAREMNSSAFLGVISAEQVFVVAKHEGVQDIGVTIRVGHRFNLTSGAHGKAIVAFMGEAERRKILNGGKLYFHGDPARLDRSRLATELARCRQRGFALDQGELNPGIHAISAPIFGPPKKIIGCIILVGIFDERKFEAYGRGVSRAARRISYQLGADTDQIFQEACDG